MDARKAALRLRDLLTMRTGVDYDESGLFSPHSRLNLLPWGRDIWYLRRPMLSPPGAVFRYDSGGAVLLSSMLQRRTGMHAEAYAARYLFAPLGIQRQSWRANLAGHTHTGGGLSLTARDTAKLGQLYLQKGRWGDAQVVPEAWVRNPFNSTSRSTPRAVESSAMDISGGCFPEASTRPSAGGASTSSSFPSRISW